MDDSSSTATAYRSTGDWCGPFFSALSNTTADSIDSSITDIDPSIACSSCSLQMGLLSQQSAFGYDPAFSDIWSTYQQICGVNYNLTVPGNAYLNV